MRYVVIVLWVLCAGVATAAPPEGMPSSLTLAPGNDVYPSGLVLDWYDEGTSYYGESAAPYYFMMTIHPVEYHAFEGAWQVYWEDGVNYWSDDTVMMSGGGFVWEGGPTWFNENFGGSPSVPEPALAGLSPFLLWAFSRQRVSPML